MAFKFINAVVGLELQGGVLLNLLVPLQGWDARFGVVKFINAVAGLGLQAVVLLSLVVLLAFKFITAVVQGWACRLWCC